MEKENDSKLDALAKCVLKQEKDIKKLKKRQPRKMTAMKFVGVVFDPEKYKAGEAEINEALSDGFEVLRDFETGGGIVIALGKWENKGKTVKKEDRSKKGRSKKTSIILKKNGQILKNLKTRIGKY